MKRDGSVGHAFMDCSLEGWVARQRGEELWRWYRGLKPYISLDLRYIVAAHVVF
jgi:hypothetical protein